MNDVCGYMHKTNLSHTLSSSNGSSLEVIDVIYILRVASREITQVYSNHTNLYYNNFLLSSAVKSINIFVRFVTICKIFVRRTLLYVH